MEEVGEFGLLLRVWLVGLVCEEGGEGGVLLG